MAIDYTLLLDTTRPAGDLADYGGTVLPIESGIRREISQESFGIEPTVSVVFRIDKDEPERSTDEMKVAVARILRDFEGDAILVNNGEHAVLRRTGASGIINERWARRFGDLLGDLDSSWVIGPDPGPVP